MEAQLAVEYLSGGVARHGVRVGGGWYAHTFYIQPGEGVMGCLGHAPTGHMGQPLCLDGPRSSGRTMPSLAGLGGSPGMARACDRTPSEMRGLSSRIRIG
jgi:hypothetical protein